MPRSASPDRNDGRRCRRKPAARLRSESFRHRNRGARRHFLLGSSIEHFQPVATEVAGMAAGRFAITEGNASAKLSSHSLMDARFGLNTTYLSMSPSFLSEIST